jgi:hypothetical protein
MAAMEMFSKVKQLSNIIHNGTCRIQSHLEPKAHYKWTFLPGFASSVKNAVLCIGTCKKNYLQLCGICGYKKVRTTMFSPSLLLLLLDPGSGMNKSQAPGSRINIPDPQHIRFQNPFYPTFFAVFFVKYLAVDDTKATFTLFF